MQPPRWGLRSERRAAARVPVPLSPITRSEAQMPRGGKPVIFETRATMPGRRGSTAAVAGCDLRRPRDDIADVPLQGHPGQASNRIVRLPLPLPRSSQIPRSTPIPRSTLRLARPLMWVVDAMSRARCPRPRTRVRAPQPRQTRLVRLPQRRRARPSRRRSRPARDEPRGAFRPQSCPSRTVLPPGRASSRGCRRGRAARLTDVHSACIGDRRTANGGRNPGPRRFIFRP